MWCTSRSTPRRTSTTNGCLPLSITTDPKVSHGGLRYPVETLLELLASDMTFDEVLADYPDLKRDDLLTALEFGALTAGGRRVDPPGAA
jgi:uncharacterized protein (DUF433 family)